MWHNLHTFVLRSMIRNTSCADQPRRWLSNRWPDQSWASGWEVLLASLRHLPEGFDVSYLVRIAISVGAQLTHSTGTTALFHLLHNLHLAIHAVPNVIQTAC